MYVRDVKRLYGHICAIPLQAYIDAGVAFHGHDLVSEADIDAAFRV